MQVKELTIGRPQELRSSTHHGIRVRESCDRCPLDFVAAGGDSSGRYSRRANEPSMRIPTGLANCAAKRLPTIPRAERRGEITGISNGGFRRFIGRCGDGGRKIGLTVDGGKISKRG